MPPASLSTLPPELLLEILSHLDIPDLLSLSRTTHIFRTLSLDPLLHSYRLLRASRTLSHSLPLRPSLAELTAQRIYETRTRMAARQLGRDLIKIQLNRRLGNRPSVQALVDMGVLPEGCYFRARGTEAGMAGVGQQVVIGYVNPVLVQRKRGLERERVKDGLRGWVAVWCERGIKRLEGGQGGQGQGEGRMDVRFLVRRWGRGGERESEERGEWGGKGKRGREEPTRAKVLGLRRFWERVGREGNGTL